MPEFSDLRLLSYTAREHCQQGRRRNKGYRSRTMRRLGYPGRPLLPHGSSKVKEEAEGRQGNMAAEGKRRSVAGFGGRGSAHPPRRRGLWNEGRGASLCQAASREACPHRDWSPGHRAQTAGLQMYAVFNHQVWWFVKAPLENWHSEQQKRVKIKSYTRIREKVLKVEKHLYRSWKRTRKIQTQIKWNWVTSRSYRKTK